VLEQSDLFTPDDLIPVPCHPDALCMGYAFKSGDGSAVPLTSMIDKRDLIDGSRNTIVFERDASIRNAFFTVFSTALGADTQPSKLKDLLCCIPKAAVPDSVGYANIFRVLILEFIDAQAFDLRSVKKSCIHIAHPDGRIIPFDTYNLFYRDELERTRLAPLREGVERAWTI
jgi:hypothetical protein